jgi:hypothetical protein
VVAVSDAVGRRLLAVNAAIFFHEGVAEEYPTIELVFDGLRFHLHTAADGSLRPTAEPLRAYSMPELSGEVRIEDWSLKPDYSAAIGAQLVRLGQILDGGTVCGAIMDFANGAQLYFVNWGDELWASATRPPSNVLDGMTIQR